LLRAKLAGGEFQIAGVAGFYPTAFAYVADAASAEAQPAVVAHDHLQTIIVGGDATVGRGLVSNRRALVVCAGPIALIDRVGAPLEDAASVEVEKPAPPAVDVGLVVGSIRRGA